MPSMNTPDHLDIEVEIDLDLLAERLLKDPKFIELITHKVRKAMTKDVRSMGTLFGKWGGTSV